MTMAKRTVTEEPGKHPFEIADKHPDLDAAKSNRALWKLLFMMRSVKLTPAHGWYHTTVSTPLQLAKKLTYATLSPNVLFRNCNRLIRDWNLTRRAKNLRTENETKQPSAGKISKERTFDRKPASLLRPHNVTNAFNACIRTNGILLGSAPPTPHNEQPHHLHWPRSPGKKTQDNKLYDATNCGPQDHSELHRWI